MAKDSAAKKVYGLIGYPVKHSSSPAMHNAAFCALGINAEYKLFPLKEEELAGFLKGLENNNIFGLNVTIPYKEKVIPFLDSLSEEVKLIGAANTIRRKDSKLEGFNTDGEGFLKHLMQELSFNPQSKAIAILGAGGAAKAVCVYLAKMRPKRINVYDLDRTKTRGLISQLKEKFSGVEFIEADSIRELAIENSDLLVNATPIGMKESDSCLVDSESIHKDLLVYDLIYNPGETELLKLAKDKGAKAANGLGMLLYQGALSFQKWTDKAISLDIMRQALQEELKRCQR